ncbi:hypothetical protein [Kitasatospora sp. NPDC097643]|uniref:hypothetical protein n=1 Tax=Kitasatospora sp. NPDC097643 TaxID=3157230 RepID=UPI003322D2C4
MQIHRSVHARFFTVLPNGLLQDRRLSYTARGLLADLLSRPDGWREDGRQMADSSTQGRGAVRRALNELKAAGYYRVETVRLPDGTVRSYAHVFDTPQLVAGPGVPLPAAGSPEPGRSDAPYVKNPEEVPTLPVELTQPDPQVREAVAALFRVVRREPRLRLGEREAAALAPLVAEWLARGCSEADLAHALLPALPQPMHSPAGVLRDRLQRKLPPPRPPDAAPGRHECAECRDPVPSPGICRACAGVGARTVTTTAGTVAEVARRGAALARAALRAGAGLALPAA